MDFGLSKISPQLSLKDISLLGGLLPDKAYAETRVPSSLIPNEEILIEDLAGAQLTLVDTLSKAFDVLIQEAKSQHYDDVEDQLQKWRFLTTWNKLAKREKDVFYDKYFCHEFNLFLKFKDPDYFEQTVRPFLVNKIEKHFLDYLLLDQDLSAFKPIDKIQKLNDLEKTLLSRVLKLKFSIKARHYNDSEFTKFFDTVLLLSKDLNQDELAQMIEEEKLRAEQSLKQQMQEKMKDVEFYHAYDDIEDLHSIQIDLCRSAAPQEIQFSKQKAKFQKKRCETESEDELDQLEGEEYCEEDEDKEEYEEVSEYKDVDISDQSSSRQYSEGEEESKFNDKKAQDEDKFLLSQRQQQQQLYKTMDATKEYSETHYFAQKYPQQFKQLIQSTPFFSNIALQEHGQANLDYTFMYSISNLAEALTTLAIIDLPFQASQHGFKPEGRGVMIKAASNMIVFCKRMGIVEEDIMNDVITAVRYFDPSDRYYLNNVGEKVEKGLKEFTTDKIIGCQVVITNLTSYHLNLSVLSEVPKNSIPIGTQESHKQKMISLPSYQTKSVDFQFYFPKVGNQMHAGVNVSNQGKVVSKSQVLNLKVKDINDQESKLTQHVSFKEIIDKGSVQQILEWIQNNQVLNSDFNFYDIYQFLSQAEFYQQFMAILSQRMIVDMGSLQFAFLHQDLPNIYE